MANIGKIAGLIAAAGYSSRMGVFKPLLPLGEKTVIETAVDSLKQGGIQDIRVITGYQGEKIHAVLEGFDGRVLDNPLYPEGMFSSILAGIRNLEPDTEAFFLLPGDNPLIRRRSIKEILRVYRKTGAAVVYPVFNGKRGHPPLISAKCFPAILRSDGAGGLRHVLARFEVDSAEAVVADEGILIDIDTVDDYRKLKEYQRCRSIPTDAECYAMLNKYQSDHRVLRHGEKVAAIGSALAVALNQAGLKLNIDLVSAGGLVHDLAKGKRNHAKHGGRLLAGMGFPELASIVGSHMDMNFSPEDAIDEMAIVFLADKLVQGDKRISLAERFHPALQKFRDNPEISRAVRQKMQAAETIQEKVLHTLGAKYFDQLA